MLTESQPVSGEVRKHCTSELCGVKGTMSSLNERSRCRRRFFSRSFIAVRMSSQRFRPARPSPYSGHRCKCHG